MVESIRVVLADDHPIVRSGIRTELASQPDIEVVGEAANGDEAFRLATELAPDVLLLDIQMPGLKAVQLLRQLRSQGSPVRVLVLTAYGDLEYVLGLLKAGATGYLLKGDEPSGIIEGVRAVAQGRQWLSEAVALNLAGLAPAGPASLTEREKELLRMLASGQNNLEIAAILGLSPGTVKSQISTLYLKIGVDSRTEAAAWAWQNGFTDKV